jgi:DNA-binding MarR family transcriptional regulator
MTREAVMTEAEPKSPRPDVPYGELNPVIHERARLGIMSMLAAARELSFNDLKAQLGLTDGNLSVHMRILESRGYLAVDKSFVLRKPRTVLRLTKAGRRTFEAYLAVLERIARAARRE